MIERFARAAAYASTLMIIGLSLVPGEMRPQTGASGHFEHVLAYAGAGFLFVAGSSLRSRLLFGVLLCLLSGLLEIGQIFVPGRTGEWPGFFASSLGALSGIMLGSIAWPLWQRLTRPPA